MKIKSLLAAVSIAALTAGTANALSIPTTTTGMPTPNVVSTVLSANGLTMANELALPADDIGSVTFAVQTDTGTLPSGNNFNVSVSLPTGLEVLGPVTGSVLTGLHRDSDAVNNDRTNDAFFAGEGSATVLSQSGSQLELFVSVPQSGDPVSALVFELPLSLVSCTVSGTLNVTITTENGNNVETPSTAIAPSPVEGCASAFDTTFTTDVVAGADDTVIGLDDYEQLRNSPGNSLTNTSVVGIFTAEIDQMVAVDLAGTPMQPAAVDEITFDVVFTDGSEIDSVEIDADNSAPNILPQSGAVSTDGNTFSFDVSPFNGPISAPIQITVEGDDPIASQPIIVNNVEHEFDDIAGTPGFDYISEENGAGGSLDALQREGQNFGVFDWNNGPAGGGTLSVYRVTGLPVGEAVPYIATVYNSGWGATDNTVSGSVTGDAAGEAVITSSTIPALAGSSFDAVKRYDFDINFEFGGDLDVDRLLLTNGTVTAIGDGTNVDSNTKLQNSPTNDSDNFGYCR